MVAARAKILPATGDDNALVGDRVKQVLLEFKAMWSEGLMPKSAQADNGANFVSNFKIGKIGIQGAGGFVLANFMKDVPDLNFGVTSLPGAKAFIAWGLSDEAQLEGLAKYNICPRALR